MNYAKIKNFDIANGEGVRVSLFVSGCTNHCKNCFQPETWDFNFGSKFTAETEDEIIKMLGSPFINGLTLLGGEPFEPQNQEVLLPFVKKVVKVYPEKNIWAFTGFLYEDLLRDGSYPRSKATDELLSMIDVLVDGRFEEDKKNLSLKFRGSSNQRLIDLKATRINGTVTLWDK